MHRSEVDSLERNGVWREIVDTLKEVKIGLFEDLANMDPNLEGTDIARKQGRLYMISFVLAQPDAILREIDEDNARNEERKEG
jgi:hypothetical protein